ncbi:carbohydrate kinase [Saccharopolyspora rhizosphaerae]|uniref:Carbohydrate kinase n=1 Tax=Saccharopolyspora rhizosphaerae TaxID=2492662 RepID=A0A3R8VD37_9PSEU|nr:gluconokinase [Saccharopolyspora rhizosphaerae]RRO15097.1 carbohydrate kinase [Saccharopolyspora rhizosphaerae]
MSSIPVVLGVDLGTTATKVVAAGTDARVLHTTERGYPLRTDEAGEATQDAAEVLRAAVEALTECASWAREQGHEVAGLSFSSAMHTLVGLDSRGEPATRAFNWADTRASEVAARLRSEPATSSALHRATGTPVHTQSVMVKLAWLTSGGAEIGEVDRWCALKDYVVSAFTGEFVTEHSLSSGSGLQDMHTLTWHEPALQVAGINAAQLPELREPTASLPLGSQVATAAGLPAGLPVVLGGGDGPLANLGVGAVAPGVAALSLGTSGALRVTRDKPGVDERCRTFSYALADGLWVIGGAVSNGGVVGQWAAEAFGVDVAELLDEAAAVPPGADGLMALPYLLGERAPWWEPGLTGAFLGLRRSHGRAEMTRAVIEGVAQQLALVRDAVADTGAEVHAVRATGGGFRSRLWAETIASALDMDLDLAEGSGGSGLGAVLLAWRALGEIDSLAHAAELVTVDAQVAPDPAAAEVLAHRRPLIDRLHQTLRDFSL